MNSAAACANGCLRASLPLWRAASKARRLSRRWDALDVAERRRRLGEIEKDIDQARSLIASVIAVARHSQEA